MLRKTNTATVLALLLTTPCFAGFYVGGSIGPEGADFSQKSHVTRYGTVPNNSGSSVNDRVISGPFDVVDREHFAGTGLFGSLLAGYAWKFDRVYLAAEANANLSSVKYKLVNDEYIHHNFSKSTVTIKNSEGISILPGYYLTDTTVFYGRVGYVNGRLKIVESDPSVRSFNTNRNGIRYGLGVRQTLTPKLTGLIEYSQINYQSVTSSVYDPFGMVRKDSRIIPHTAQVAFGLLYNFE